MSADEQLIAALHLEHAAILTSFVMRYLPDRHVADDVVQETFIRVWRRLDDIDTSTGRIRSYMFTTARNILTDQWRSEERRSARQVVVAWQNQVTQVTQDDHIESLFRPWYVADALTVLSANHRAVVESLYFQGRSVRETAHVLGIPEGTVKSRSYHALRALRSAFDEMGVLG